MKHSDKEHLWKSSIVLDIGSGISKIGFNDSFKPDVFPTVISRNSQNDQNPYFYVGEEAKRKKGISNLSYPVKYGIGNLDNMEHLWNHALYNQLSVSPSEWTTLFTEVPLISNDRREAACSFIFESLCPSAMYFENQATLSLYASGRTTGLILESGFEITHVVPVFEGCAMRHGIQRMKDIGGMSVENYFVKILKDNGFETSIEDRDVVRELKEKLCYVSKKYEEECLKKKTTGYDEEQFDLPDHRKIIVGSERFKATEMMFKPSLAGLKLGGVHESIFKSIQLCDNDIKSDLFENIVIGGGGTFIKGLKERLLYEIKALEKKNNVDSKVDSKVNINVFGNKDRKYSAWIGGSVLTSLSSFYKKWATKDKYDEVGCKIIHRWCL